MSHKNEQRNKVIEDVKKLKKPLIIGVSGFGGAGKSTFANALGKELSVQVVGVDHFMKDNTVTDYSLWEAMDFERLKREVLLPFLNGEHGIRYGQFSCGENKIKNTANVGKSDIIIVEGVGLFRPGINNYLGYKIWIDCTVETSIERGKKRDREVHNNPQDESWDGVWKRNDKECYDTYKPKNAADVVIDNCNT